MRRIVSRASIYGIWLERRVRSVFEECLRGWATGDILGVMAQAISSGPACPTIVVPIATQLKY